MAEHTQLSILERKLKRIRIFRPISQFLAVIVSFVVFSYITSQGLVFLFFGGVWITGLVWFIITVAASTILKRHYNKKEEQVIWQIHKLKLNKGYR